MKINSKTVNQLAIFSLVIIGLLVLSIIFKETLDRLGLSAK
jgi:hypothetical protein